ncbi:MAG: histidine kinase [Rikenellaceae bacterium]
MIRDESKIFRYLDWAFYLIFIPVILLLIPTNRLMDRDPYFFLLMMAYIMVVHIINRRLNFAEAILHRNYHRAAVAIVAVAIVSYITLQIRVDDMRELTSNMTAKDIKNFRHRVLFTLLFIDICFTVMLALIAELFRQRIERQEIEAAKSKAEAAIYKSQINPHFMFNTLNTIYALHFTGSDKTGEVIMKFSNIVKYIYQNSDKDKIMISEEVKYLREFIELHTLRLSDTTKVNFSSEVDDDSQFVPSMILITFVENVFKYGVSSSCSSEVDIAVCLRRKELLFETRNQIFARQDGSTSGIGIENCRKRLELLYPSRYSLACEEHDNIYTTKLRIEL